MIDQDLLSGIKEFSAAAEDEEKKERYRSAVTLYFKALALACDLAIYRKVRVIPNSHSDRFRLLERVLPDAYPIVNRAFAYYTDTYSKAITKKHCEEIRGALHEVLNITGIESEL